MMTHTDNLPSVDEFTADLLRAVRYKDGEDAAIRFAEELITAAVAILRRAAGAERMRLVLDNAAHCAEIVSKERLM